jgi:flagellar motor component MotA
MKQLFYEGGALFMGTLTIILILMLAWTVYHFIQVMMKKVVDLSKAKEKLIHIKTIGTFALVFGILGQLIGLMSAFDAIQQMGGVSPALLMGGLKVSLIPTLYGIFIFLMSLLLWFITDLVISKKSE